MKRSTNLAWAELKVGILLVAAFLIGTIGIVSFSGIREYFRPSFPLHTDFRKVSGLKPGAVVMLSGIHVGNVRSLAFHGGERQEVRVTMKIYRQYQEDIRKDALATLGSQGLLGDKYVELVPGSPEQPAVERDDTIAGDSGMADLDRMVNRAENVTEKLGKTLDELTALAKGLREGEGTAGRLLSDPALYERAREAAGELAGTAKELSGTARELRRTAKAYQDLGDEVSAGLVRPDGTLKRLAENPEPFERLNASLGRLDALLARMEQGEGTLGKILQDDTVAEEVTGLIRDMRALVQDVKANPKRYLHVEIF